VAVLLIGALGTYLALFHWRTKPNPPSSADRQTDPAAESGGDTHPPIADFFGPAANMAQIKEEELKLAAHLLTVFPGNVKTWLLLGNIHYQHGDVPQAMEAWTQGLSQDPRQVEFHLRLGRAAAGLEDPQRALDYWQQGLTMEPNAPEFRWEIANLLVAQGRYPQAAPLLEQEVGMNPGSTRSLFLLGQTYLKIKDYQRAILFFEKTLALDPNHSNACYGLGTAYLRLKNRTQAQAYMARFQKAKQRNRALPENRIPLDEVPGARRRMARRYGEAYRIYEQAGRSAAGEILLHRALELDPKNAQCLEKLGLLYYARHRLVDALQVFEQACQADPDNPLFYLNVGKISTALRRFPQAEQAYRQTINRFPENSHGYAELARLYLRYQPRNTKALALAQQAVAYEASAAHYYLLALANDAHSHTQAARDAVAQALALDATNQTYRMFHDTLQKKALLQRP